MNRHCPHTNKILKAVKVNEGQWRSVEVSEGQWRSVKVSEGQWRSVEFRKKVCVQLHQLAMF